MCNANTKFKNTYDKWTKMLYRVNVLVVLFVCLIEILMYFVMTRLDVIGVSTKEYLIRFLVLPTAMNTFIVCIGGVIAKRINSKSSLRDYIPMIELDLMGIVIAITHYVFSVTLTVFCIPVYCTIIYGKKKITNTVFAVGLASLLISLCGRNLITYRKNDSYLIPDAIVAITILVVTYLSIRVLTDFQAEKNRIIIENYNKQVNMQELIDKDQKTGLYGHTAFMDKLNKCVDDCSNGADSFALAVLDIDNFKLVNDTYGHSNGDKVIKSLANIMLKMGKERQFCARFGGEEFAIIFDSRTASNCFEYVEELREEFAKLEYDFSDKNVTVSCGISKWKNNMTSEDIFAKADKAMYKSKKEGKNKTTIL